MKHFFTQVLATMTGCLFSVILLCGLCFVAVVVLIGLGSGETNDIPSASILHITLSESVVDRAQDNPIAEAGFTGFGTRALGLNTLLTTITSAANDPDIAGIFLEPGGMSVGMATLEEIRGALKEFSICGKFIYAYADDYSQAGYFLASVADSIFVSPMGGVTMKGLAFQTMFFKGALDKLGIRSQIFRHGRYKSAVEPFMQRSMSTENREQLDACIRSMWAVFRSECASARHIDPSVFDSAAEDMLVRTAADAVALKLVDRAVYKDEVLRLMARHTGEKDITDLSFIGCNRYARSSSFRSPWKKGPSSSGIAVIYASGDIDRSSSAFEGIGSATFSRTIRDAALDKDIKAIVLRVNSPGGDALASDVIWHEVAAARRSKPVIVSMGDYAASGGYYISCAADTIITNAATLTGSIGVFSLMFNIQDLLDARLGISFDAVRTHSHADFPSPFRPLTPAEAQVFQSDVDRIYDAFTTRVSEGRRIPKETLDPLCNGRIWAGSDAIGVRLADRVGGLQAAIDAAVRRAGLTSYTVVEMPPQRDVFQELLDVMNGEAENRAIGRVLGASRWYIDALRTLPSLQGPQARLPFRGRLQW